MTPPVPIQVPNVPFYSQFQDIQSTTWQKVGCGITSLAMVIDYYKPDSVTVNQLLGQGILAGAYDTNAGWIHKGLISLSTKYGMEGNSYNFSSSKQSVAFAEFKKFLDDGPVIVSIHYKFNPKSTIPHLVVIEGIQNGVIYYNDPALKTGQKTISTEDFQKGWKKKFIVIRPKPENKELTLDLINKNNGLVLLNQNNNSKTTSIHF